MPKFKILVTDYEYESLKIEEKIIQENGGELLKAQCKTEEEVINAAKDVDGLLVQYAPIGRKVFESLPKLKVVARYGIGVDVIDVTAATEHDVAVLNVPDYCVEEVSDHALALLLACGRKIVLLNSLVKEGKWDYKLAKPIYRLKNKTLGLIGFGKIARNLAKKASSLGLKILSFDPFLDHKITKHFNVELVNFNTLLRASDYISIHVPLNQDTKHLISIDQFEMMKKSAYLINTSRGPIIDEKALINALRNNQISGAALDVTEEEPLNKNSDLLNMENVIITPHTAWYSEESELTLHKNVAEGVVDFLTGKSPLYLVNKNVQRKF